MPRGRARALGTAEDISEARRDRAIDLAVALSALSIEGDERVSSEKGRRAIINELGISYGEYRRRLADARQLLAPLDTLEARAVFSFGPRTVLIDGARYRTRQTELRSVVAGSIYAILEGGELVSTFAGESLASAPVGTGAYWRRVRALMGQGYSSTQAINLAAGETEEREYIVELSEQQDIEVVELLGSSYPPTLELGDVSADQSTFID